VQSTFVILRLVLVCRPTAASLSGHEMLKQIHRKHNPPPLTELLRPLNPISASNLPVPGE